MLACDCRTLGSLPSPTHAIVPAWQTDPQALRSLARQVSRSTGFAGLGASSVVSSAGSGAAAGSAAGPIGAAVGAVLGAAVGLLHKTYFHVQASNQLCGQVLNLWNQYLQVQGHVAGRAIGQTTMQSIFHGAVGAGLFPGNDMHLSFHGGTLQCAGHGDWVDEFLGATACGAHNCMPDAINAYASQQAQKPPSTPDAVYVVDNILLPMNQHAGIPWIWNGAQNPQVHQLLYDLADSYLGSNTVPYVEYPQAAPVTAVPTTTAPGGFVSIAPTPTAPVTTAPQPTGIIPVGTPSIPISVATPANPPAVNTVVTTIPEGTTGTALTLPAGTWSFAGVDASGGWIVKDATGQLWHLSGTQLVPLTGVAAASTVNPNVSYVPSNPSGYMPSYPTTPAATAPAGTTAAIATTGFGSTGILLGIGLLGLAFFATKKGEG